jgi:hypothetical protein
MPPDERFIRNIRFTDHAKQGKVFRRAFKPDRDDLGQGLSVTRCGTRIVTDTDVDAYRTAACEHPAGLLGVCFLDDSQVRSIGLTVLDDPKDGHAFADLHCLLRDESEPDLCPNDDKQRQLAMFASVNGHIREMNPG